jgi:hypothetical protein
MFPPLYLEVEAGGHKIVVLEVCKDPAWFAENLKTFPDQVSAEARQAGPQPG